jgi:hypothetical protein
MVRVGASREAPWGSSPERGERRKELVRGGWCWGVLGGCRRGAGCRREAWTVAAPTGCTFLLVRKESRKDEGEEKREKRKEEGKGKKEKEKGKFSKHGNFWKKIIYEVVKDYFCKRKIYA